MFYCDECAKERKYPLTSFRSYGACEICGKTRACNDMPSKYLPKQKENQHENQKQEEEMNEDYRCPQCGSIKSWHFSEGESAECCWDRFDKINPDTGHCWKCGFGYSEHVNHPLREQVEKFRKDRRLKKEEKHETKAKLIPEG